ncbi:MAG TPA: M1 family aminopeptidase, partial [Ignavibacteriaceae bacterium]|nr:M1 family aminopeptidase [Ignavibacteriaceae bacterium]
YQQYNTYFHYGVSDSMLISHFVYPESFNSAKQFLDETDNMIAVFSEKFGLYPFINEKYGHAEIEGGTSMEHQTCSSMGWFGTSVVSHELAHQWFGDKITCKDWHHIWLNEGFATYLESIYLEAKSGISAYNSQIQSEMNQAKNANGSIWVQNISSVGQIFNGSRSYAKGACVLHMLRGVVGDSTFFNIMRTYSDHPSVAYGVATTEDFQSVAEDVSNIDLDYFFQEWIYGENYPKYSINWSRNELGGNIFQVNLNIVQNTNSNPNYFTMPIKIKINTSAGDTVVTLFNNAQNQNFQLNVTGNPTSINFDYGNWILKDVLNISTGVENTFSPDKFSLMQNYPNPFNPKTTISYQVASKSHVTLKIYNILGNEVATLVNEVQSAGEYKVDFNAETLSSGVYFYKLTASNPESGSEQVFSETRKLILMK